MAEKRRRDLVGRAREACAGLPETPGKECVAGFIREHIYAAYQPFQLFQDGSGGRGGRSGWDRVYARGKRLLARSATDILEELFGGEGDGIVFGRRVWVESGEPSARLLLSGVKALAELAYSELERFSVGELVVFSGSLRGVQRSFRHYQDPLTLRVLSRFVSLFSMYLAPIYAAGRAGLGFHLFLANAGGKYYAVVPRDRVEALATGLAEAVEWASTLLPELGFAYSVVGLREALEDGVQLGYVAAWEAASYALVQGARPQRIYSPGVLKVCPHCGLRPVTGGSLVCRECNLLHRTAERMAEQESGAGTGEGGKSRGLLLYISGFPASGQEWGEGVRAARLAALRGDVDGLGELMRSTLQRLRGLGLREALETLVFVEAFVSWLLGWSYVKAIRELARRLDEFRTSMSRRAGLTLQPRFCGEGDKCLRLERERLLAGLVYLGGDDVYAFTPVWAAIPLSVELANQLSELTSKAAEELRSTAPGGAEHLARLVEGLSVRLSASIVIAPIDYAVTAMNTAEVLMHDFVKRFKTARGHRLHLAIVYSERALAQTPSRALETLESLAADGLSLQPLSEERLAALVDRLLEKVLGALKAGKGEEREEPTRIVLERVFKGVKGAVAEFAARLYYAPFSKRAAVSGVDPSADWLKPMHDYLKTVVESMVETVDALHGMGLSTSVLRDPHQLDLVSRVIEEVADKKRLRPSRQHRGRHSGWRPTRLLGPAESIGVSRKASPFYEAKLLSEVIQATLDMASRGRGG